MRIISSALLVIWLCGCGPGSGGKPSAGQDVINTMSQKNSIDAGKRTADKVRAIGAQEQKDRNEAMGE
jgi:hypothetical protein